MNCTFGLIDSLPVDAEHKKIRNKQMRYTAVSERALAWMDAWVQQDTGVAEATESE
jgi:folate-dependent tRNA-U54 methylase TrmFO/GidA